MSNQATLNLTEALLTDHVRHRPNANALIVDYGAGAQPLELSYSELQQRVLQSAGGFQQAWDLANPLIRPQLAAQANRHILIALPDGEDFIFAFFGAIAAGFIPIPASNQLTARELEFIANDAAVNWLVADTNIELTRTVSTITPASLKRANPLQAYAATDAESPAYMLYTSGTTSQPKAVMHAHRVIHGRSPIVSDWLSITPQDRLLHAGALNWSYTLGVGLMDSWAAGATAIVCPASKDGAKRPASYWPETIARNSATVFAAVPGVYRQILKQADKNLPQQLESLRHGVCAGEALSEALLNEWLTASGKPLYEALGMTECSTYISSGPNTKVRPGAAGQPQAKRLVSVLKADCTSLAIEFTADDEEGLLALHRDEDGLMLGYWQRDEENRNCWLGDWFLTGDRVKRDADGYIWHCGRNSDLMNPQGYRVAPQEIEAQLSGTEGLVDIAVAELAVSATQQHIVAFIVISDGYNTVEVQRRLEKAAAEHLANYKHPRVYATVNALPRTRNGKLRRADLAGMLADSEAIRAER